MRRKDLASPRTFLHTAAAATAASWFVPASALGFGDRAPANDRIVMGSIGVGRMASGKPTAGRAEPDRSPGGVRRPARVEQRKCL